MALAVKKKPGSPGFFFIATATFFTPRNSPIVSTGRLEQV
jgi:hypothetical protein